MSINTCGTAAAVLAVAAAVLAAPACAGSAVPAPSPDRPAAAAPRAALDIGAVVALRKAQAAQDRVDHALELLGRA